VSGDNATTFFYISTKATTAAKHHARIHYRQRKVNTK
jgi:hypothetical protein